MHLKMYNSGREAVNCGRQFRMPVKPAASFNVSEYKVILSWRRGRY